LRARFSGTEAALAGRGSLNGLSSRRNNYCWRVETGLVGRRRQVFLQIEESTNAESSTRRVGRNLGYAAMGVL
jgi:hypothetical protein